MKIKIHKGWINKILLDPEYYPDTKGFCIIPTIILESDKQSWKEPSIIGYTDFGGKMEGPPYKRFTAKCLHFHIFFFWWHSYFFIEFTKCHII